MRACHSERSEESLRFASYHVEILRGRPQGRTQNDITFGSPRQHSAHRNLLLGALGFAPQVSSLNVNGMFASR